MKHNLKTVLTLFSMLLCFSVFAQGPPGGGGQGGRGGGKGCKYCFKIVFHFGLIFLYNYL